MRENVEINGRFLIHLNGLISRSKYGGCQIKLESLCLESFFDIFKYCFSLFNVLNLDLWYKDEQVCLFVFLTYKLTF